MWYLKGVSTASVEGALSQCGTQDINGTIAASYIAWNSVNNSGVKSLSVTQCIYVGVAGLSSSLECNM